MASSKKQKGMVFHQEGAATPAAAPAGDHPSAYFVVPKPGKAGEGGMESTRVTSAEAYMMDKPNMYPSKEAFRTFGGPPAMKHLARSNITSDNLSPDSICKGIRVTLDNNSMWNEFFRCKTEMILTKQGSRMFPYCRFRISGLQPSSKYSLIMDIQPLDNSRYKWTGKSWQVAGKADCHVKSQPFAHPESPSTGQHWMQNPVSFYKLKLTNNITDQEGNTILHPMHRYLPRLHLVQTDKAAEDIKLSDPSVVTFTFPQTEFMAVTAYQNSRFAQLKVDYNPFAKGLKEDGSSSLGIKLKLNSGKNSLKDGGLTTNEQHPLKKSLKSLLANHKPRSSKALDSKPSVSGDLQKNHTTDEDDLAAKVAGESSCSSPPARKLFSELIREAHVSLQRCNLEQLAMNNSTSEQTNTKTTASKSNVQHVYKRESLTDRTHRETSPAEKGETVVTKRKVKENKGLTNSVNCKDSVRTDVPEVSIVAAPAVSQNSSVDSDRLCKPEVQSEVKVKQHKRPVPLPLPALARFLKQHSKSKKAKLDTPVFSSESLSEAQSSALASECLRSDQAGSAPGYSADLTGDVTESSSHASGPASAHLHPDEMDIDISGQAVKAINQPSSPSCADVVATAGSKEPTGDILSFISDAESRGSEPAMPDATAVLPNSDKPFCNLGLSKSISSIISSTLATSSLSAILSPPLDIVLPALNSPKTQIVTESSTLPSEFTAMKSDSLVTDPECSSFGFEPLSPASSPGPLPSLPASLTLQLSRTPSESTPKTATSEALPDGESSAGSVFKWHTVLPLSEPYIDASFTSFHSTPHTLPLVPVTSSLLPSHTPSNNEPQTFDTSMSASPPDPAPSFQENEQSLPFPAELSPLALQLPLSPTFPSLDGDGLSPTPSLTDLVHFFSNDDDLGMGVDFSNTEVVAVPCPPPSTAEANAHEISHQVQPTAAKKSCKHKKKSLRRKRAKSALDQDDSTYARMQPNLEEVEEQLFISFTSKEALKLHVVDSPEETVSQPQTTPEEHLQLTTNAPENAETAENLEEEIAAFEKILQRDLRLMRHRQVIHPVLQEVGLKMNLLDVSLAIDLQYLGVRLPIPPPGARLEPPTQELPTSQGVCAAFVSRTGKTTDVTQIKGWREKFTPSEALPTPAPPKPEAGPSSDAPKKNLSAFCSDMLDEYLENEGKLIDERAASFSQPAVEPVVYELPTRSTSYVRTLDSILKKQSGSSPTSDLISGFIPPSKRPKLILKGTKPPRREKTKLKGLKPNKARAEAAAAAAPVSADVSGPADSNLVPKQPAAQTPDSAKSPILKKTRKIKPRTLSQTLSPPRSMVPLHGVSEDMAPLESDSELGTAIDQSDETSRKDGGTVLTRALLRQRDLEDGVVWGGRPRTSITEERASIALMSLFTLKGFVSENPTAPIQPIRRRAPPCLNEFCRLGCVCSSLSLCSRISHCGRPSCMLGCSCLKQKVVLLKNLDGSDSSPSHHGNNKKKKRRRRRMKMAYILKEADSVSQPAERVRTLWKRDDRDSDPDPVQVPRPAPHCPPAAEKAEDRSSCARVRGYRGRKGKKIQRRKHNDSPRVMKLKNTRLKPLKPKDVTVQETKSKASSPPPVLVQQDPSDWPPSPPTEPPPKPSKRLIILAECKWESEAERGSVLKELCERMAFDLLDKPFWIRNHLISPIGQTLEESATNSCIQYKVHISTPKVGRGKPAAAVKPSQEKEKTEEQQQQHLRQVLRQAEPFEDWQREVEEEEAEPLEDWQREVEEEEAEPLEDLQQEVEDDDIKEEAESTGHRIKETSGEEIKNSLRKKKLDRMALPFLTGISHAGFLSANKKQPGGTDHLIQVNSKLYPLAKIQLGMMGALHPANRLAAYLTGRVGSNRKRQGSSANLPEHKSSGPTPHTVSQASSMVSDLTATPSPTSLPSVTMLTASPAATVAPLKVNQSAASSDQPTGKTPEGAESQAIKIRVYPVPVGGASQVPVVPGASGSFAPSSGSQLNTCTAPPPEAPQLLILQVPGVQAKVPVQASAPCRLPPPSAGQRMRSGQAPLAVQYFYKPDGKLVQLVPINQLRSVNPMQSVLRGSPSLSVLPSSSHQTPVVTVGNQTLPVTTVKTSSSTSSSCSSSSSSSSFSPSGLQHLITPRLTSASGFLPQERKCTLKLLPSGSNKEPIFITCPPLPPRPPTKVVGDGGPFTLLQPQPSVTPMKLVSLKPSAGLGAEHGIKTVTISPVPVAPAAALVHQKPASPQTTTATEGTAHTPPAPPPSPPASEITPASPPPPPVPDQDDDLLDDQRELVTTETESGAEPSLDLVKQEALASSETDNSSDFKDQSDSEGERSLSSKTKEEEESVQQQKKERHLHNTLEKQRRAKMRLLFEALRREVGLRTEKTSKISTLEEAKQVIRKLKKTERDLIRKKTMLQKWRDDCLITISEATEGRWQGPPETGSKDAGVEVVVDLLEDTEELTENSSDEERGVAKTTSVITITDTEDEVSSVAMEKCLLDAAERRLASIMRSSLSVRKLAGPPSVSSTFKALSSDTRDSERLQLLNQVHQEIQTLQSETERLKSVKTCLYQQRNAFIREISQRSGKSEQRILRKLQHLLSVQRKMERRHKAANQLSAATGGGATDDNIKITSSALQQETPQAPVTTVSAPTTTAPAATPVQTPVQQPQIKSQKVLQAFQPSLPPHAISHNASVLRDRPRTIPNILSRRKTSAPPPPSLSETVEKKKESLSFQALLPAEVLSLVGAASPGRQVLTLSPVTAGRTVLQTSSTPGVASVTLNIPSLTNQQICLTSVPHPTTATNFNNLLQLVQPSPRRQQQQQQQQQTQQQQQQEQQTQQQQQQEQQTQQQQQQTQQQLLADVPPHPPSHPPPPSLVVLAGSDLSLDRIRDQDPAPCRSDCSPDSGRGASPSGGTNGRRGEEQQEKSGEEEESLTSLLNEIVFLNQQAITTAEAPLPRKPSSEVGQEEEEGHAHSPWLLQLDSDTDDAVTMETEKVGLNDHTQTTQSRQPADGGALAPPPLLQMKVGGAGVVDLTSSDEAAAGEAGNVERKERGVAWRPMPRLVPLGLRGNPPT